MHYRVFESICQVERGFDVPGDDNVGDNELRCETRATVEADTISVLSRSDIIDVSNTKGYYDLSPFSLSSLHLPHNSVLNSVTHYLALIVIAKRKKVLC